MSMISELVKELRWIADHEYQSRNSEDTIRRAADTIEMLSEKAREPKEGEWICELINPLNAILHCSACGYATGTKYNFCPHCGARMKGANDEH